MYVQFSRWRVLVTFFILLGAKPLDAKHKSIPRPDGPTCNEAGNRACWNEDFDIFTDYEELTPLTGRRKDYTFELTEIDDYVGGDGVVKSKAMLVNGQFPGPTVVADWGDEIQVTVINNLQSNGTSMHWHGIRQLNSCTQDGTNGITSCPTPPSGSKTYKFLATQYGTAWYHSHFSAQYGNGVLGAIIINGPSSMNYDIDLGPLLVGDWYHAGADAIISRVNNPNNPFRAGVPGSPPPSDNVLFNGLNISPDGTGGDYHTMQLTPGKRHRVHLINHSVENTFTLSLVGHSFWIIATDMVPVEPVRVESIYISIGQRYDIIIDADKEVGTYWFNATFSSSPCGASKNPFPAAIFAYDGAPHEHPQDQGTKPADTLCADSHDYNPIVPKYPPLEAFNPSPDDTLNVKLKVVNDSIARVFWPINNTPMNIKWGQPTLKYVLDKSVKNMVAEENVIHVQSEEKWAFWLIQNDSPIAHPMHLHGHDILVLGASPPPANSREPGSKLIPYDPGTDKAKLRGTNPTRRDSTVLPAWGWSVVAYHTNNPGAWVFHCHVAWHVSQGMSVQFLEQESKIAQVMDLSDLNETCEGWNAYYPNAPFRQDDSGL